MWTLADSPPNSHLELAEQMCWGSPFLISAMMFSIKNATLFPSSISHLYCRTLSCQSCPSPSHVYVMAIMFQWWWQLMTEDFIFGNIDWACPSAILGESLAYSWKIVRGKCLEVSDAEHFGTCDHSKWKGLKSEITKFKICEFLLEWGHGRQQ